MDKPSQGDTPDPALDINDADWRQIEKASWRSWINRLAKILEVKSVPGGHSKGHEPFVTFVSELQKYVPAECQRRPTAIADALTR